MHVDYCNFMCEKPPSLTVGRHTQAVSLNMGNQHDLLMSYSYRIGR